MAKKFIGAAAVILDTAGRVLLVKHTYGKLNWELPGGAAEEKESLAGTAIREVLEETGLAVAVERMVGRIYYDPNYDMHHFVFCCRLVTDTAGAGADSPEISEWGHFPIDALPRPISDFTVRRIQDAIAQCDPGVVEIGPRVWIE
ncbi:MAG TPA: NUDIX domain-containing protein [Symbiobacteriaceae bacterium]|nr:NUDIX domain-containing protein [Symbiobacteriaceae bacterium]